MRIRTLVLVPVLVIAVLLAGTAGCKKEPTGEPAVVSDTPPVEQPAESVEPTPTPLGEIKLTLEPVASGFEQPLYVTGYPDGSGRIVVLEKTGRAWLVDDGAREPEPFLDLSAVVSTSSEQGLLGMAFPPNFVESQTVWVNYTRGDGATVVSSFSVEGDRVVPASEYVWLVVPQPYPNHNGGMIAFGPDGYLYYGLGDGGGAGDLWIGDVGQNAWEEIDFQPADPAGGENYGWNILEGTHPYPDESAQPDLSSFTMPIVEYGRDAGTSVTGGYVYHGVTEPEFYGTYFYADFSVGRIWGLQAGSSGVETRELLDTDLMIASFGEDDSGELYVVDLNGGVYRMVAE